MHVSICENHIWSNAITISINDEEKPVKKLQLQKQTKRGQGNITSPSPEQYSTRQHKAAWQEAMIKFTEHIMRVINILVMFIEKHGQNTQELHQISVPDISTVDASDATSEGFSRNNGNYNKMTKKNLSKM